MCDCQAHLEPLARVQIEVHAHLPVRADFALIAQQNPVQRKVRKAVYIQLPANRIMCLQTNRVLQNPAGKRLRSPVVAVQVRRRSKHRLFALRPLKIDRIREIPVRRVKMHQRIVRIHMHAQPLQHRLLVIDRPRQLMRMPVRNPRTETLAVLVQDILAKLLVLMLDRIERPRQTGRQVLPLRVQRCGVVLVVIDFVVVV